MDVKAVIATYKQKIDEELERFLDAEMKYGSAISPKAVDMADKVREFNLRGGKRLRPVLMIHGYKCLKKENPEIVRASLAVELLEGYLLMHDDVMDADEVRRGKPSTWKLFETVHKDHRWKGNPTKFGESAAIIAGDIACSLASDAIIKTNFPDPLKVRAIEKLDRININTGYGQMLDILGEVMPEITEKDVLKIHEFKTSKYTIEGPLHLGATLAGAGQKELDALTRYGIPVGQAFQIQDDILGMYGDEQKTGKSAASDLKEGKHTMLILEAEKRCTSAQWKEIERALGNRDATGAQVARVRDIIKDCGSLDYSRELAKKLAAKAKRDIQKSAFKREGKDFLVAMADYLINRDY